MTDTRTPYEAMHRELEAGINEWFLEEIAESFGFNAAEMQQLTDGCPSLRVDDDDDNTVVQGPW